MEKKTVFVTKTATPLERATLRLEAIQTNDKKKVFFDAVIGMQELITGEKASEIDALLLANSARDQKDNLRCVASVFNQMKDNFKEIVDLRIQEVEDLEVKN